MFLRLFDIKVSVKKSSPPSCNTVVFLQHHANATHGGHLAGEESGLSTSKPNLKSAIGIESHPQPKLSAHPTSSELP